MTEWSWYSTLTSSLSACVSNFGYFLELCKCSSLSIERFKLTVDIVFDADICLVVRRRTIGDCVVGCSRLADESNKASSDPSDKVDGGVWQLIVFNRYSDG